MRCTGPRREAFPSRLRARLRTARASSRSERGSVAVSVILIPLALTAVFGTIHLALVLHGRNVASAAAQDALHARAQFGAEDADGYAAAYAILDLFKGIEGADVDVDKTGDTVTVTITGKVITPIDTFFSDFDVQVSGPAEKFYLESER